MIDEMKILSLKVEVQGNIFDIDLSDLMLIADGVDPRSSLEKAHEAYQKANPQMRKVNG